MTKNTNKKRKKNPEKGKSDRKDKIFTLDLSSNNEATPQERLAHSGLSQSNGQELGRKGGLGRPGYEKASSIHQVFPESFQTDSDPHIRPFQTNIAQPRITRYRSTDRLLEYPLKSSLSVMSVQKYNTSVPKIVGVNPKKTDPCDTTKLKAR